MEKRNVFDPDNESHAEMLQNLAMLSDDDNLSEANDDSSDSEEDYVEKELEDSDTDQDISSENEICEPELVNVVFGKDNLSQWELKQPAQKVRTPSHNIVRDLPGVRGAAKGAKSVIACWGAFFDDDLLNIIVTNTNRYIAGKKELYSRERDCKTTTLSEIKAFIGLLYMAGYHRNSRLNTLDFWALDGSGIELFRMTMSRNRFHFLLQTIRFDNKTTRPQRKLLDKLAPIRDVVDKFVALCKTNYSVGEYVTVDEMLPPFRGKCSFRQYIPSKPSKYGIKIISLADSKVFYTLNFEIYVGKQPDGPFQVDNSAISVVKRLCEPIKGSGRNLTGDNWFTSHELVTDLLKNYKLTYVGTVRKNKKHLPLSFVSVQNRKPCTSQFAFQKNVTLVSYIPKKGKNVLLLSTMHHDSRIDLTTGEKLKPEIVTFYNETKSGVDAVDKLCATYSVSRNTNRWPMAVFYTLLNIAGINAYVVYKDNQNEEIKHRRHFIKYLALELTREHIQNRSQINSLPKEIRKRTAEMAFEANSSTLKSGENEEHLVKITENIRKRCFFCERKKNRKTKYQCLECHKYICLEHSNYICNTCSSKRE